MNFVTGGTGLVGARLIFDLISKGEEVTAIYREGTSTQKFTHQISHYTDEPDKIGKQVNWVQADLLDLERMYQVIPEKAKVYHCAAMVSFNQKKAETIIDTNVEGTANLVNVCIKNKVLKLCHVSSIGALGGKISQEEITEETPWSAAGKSAYSLSKYYSELEVWRGKAEGLNTVIVNPAVILGPGDWNYGSPQLFSMIAKGMRFYTLGSTSYVDVRDVTRAMILLMNSDISNKRFLLASETLTYKELFDKIAKVLMVKPPQFYALPIMTAIAYRFDGLKSRILNKEPRITKQTHKISHTLDSYNGKKIAQDLGFEYQPIAETINFIGDCFGKSK